MIKEKKINIMTQENNSTFNIQHSSLENLAPIVLFVYNRPDHTRQTVEALQKNELAIDSELFIYSDAAKDETAEQKVNEVRQYIKNINGFKRVTIIEREKNWGLANSIIDGVTKIVNEYGKIIVLEDDLVTSPYFLKFMNGALEIYKDEEKVYSITGYSFSDDISLIDSTYFLSITSSWSWATWEHKWQDFKRDKQALQKYIDNKSNRNVFNFNNSYDYVSMAKKQLEGKLDSWAIFWYFSVLQKQGLTLYPSKSLVHNIGFDGSGVHCGDNKVEKKLENIHYSFTKDILEKEINKVAIGNVLKGEKRSFRQKIISKAKKLLTNSQKQKISFILSKLKLFIHKKDIGKNSYIDKSVNVLGWSHVSIGENTVVGGYSWLNVNQRIKGFKHIEIGNNCYLGKRTFLSSAKKIKIKDYCLIGDDCKFIGANHIYNNPMLPYSFSGASKDETILVGVNVWFGTMICVIGNVSIGRGSVIGAGSVVTKDIPPFSVAVGNPCKVIKRYNFNNQQWIDISIWEESFANYFPSEEEYLIQMQSNILDTYQYRYAASHNFGDLI